MEKFGWGYNGRYQIAADEEKELHEPLRVGKYDVRQLYCGNEHSVILLKNGSMLGMGSNQYGQIFKEGEYKLEDPVAFLGGEVPAQEWSVGAHNGFDFFFKQAVFAFMICMHKTVPSHLTLPKPILSIVINFTL